MLFLASIWDYVGQVKYINLERETANPVESFEETVLRA